MTTAPRTNPWLVTVGLMAAGAGIIGLVLTLRHPDPTALGYSPVAAVWGSILITLALGLVVVLLLAGAIGWQLRQLGPDAATSTPSGSRTSGPHRPASGPRSD